MGKKKIEYVIDAMEEGKLPVKKQWSLEIQREILHRIHERARPQTENGRL